MTVGFFSELIDGLQSTEISPLHIIFLILIIALYKILIGSFLGPKRRSKRDDDSD